MGSFDDTILKLHPDTVTTVRKLYNLDKREDMDGAIDALEDWLKKQHHLTKRDYPRDFLERSIILMKGSVERAKSQIDNLCSMRTLFPKFFEKYDARNDFDSMNPVLVHAVMPTLTKDHYRVFISYFKKDGITSVILMDAYRFSILKSEYVKAHDYCNGFVGIFDLRNVNLTELISSINFQEIHQLLRIEIEGYGMRIKGMHALTSSRAIQILVNMLKPVVGPKIASRFHVHTSVETLYEHVPREILPAELGGCGESVDTVSEKWKDVLGRKDNVNYMQEISGAVSNEAYKMKEKLNNLDLGLAGTFRSLTVD